MESESRSMSSRATSNARYPETSVGPYRLLEPMGRGGLGVVFRAQHQETGLHVALKTTQDGSRTQRLAMRNEIALLSWLGQLNHPGVVSLLEAGIAEGDPWYAMEFIEGRHLAAIMEDWWKKPRAFHNESHFRSVFAVTAQTMTLDVPSAQELAPLPSSTPPPSEVGNSNASDAPQVAAGRLPEALVLAEAITEALAAIHQRGVVHGDLSPRNILVRTDRSPVLLDFGAAIRAFAGSVAREVPRIEGLVRGTVGCMAPELLRGTLPDARSDLYALGCILYEMLTGHPPFGNAGTQQALIAQHLNLAPQPMSTWVQSIPSGLDQLVMQLLAKDPLDRVSYADDVRRVLGSLQTKPSEPRRTPEKTSLYRARLIGRGDILDRLRGSLDAARAGNGGVILVAGEGGVGKTRILNQVAALAIGQGFEVTTWGMDLHPNSGELERTTEFLAPFRPFLQALADAAAHDASGPETSHTVRIPLPALAALTACEPLLLQQPGVQEIPLDPLPPELAAGRLHRSLGEALMCAGQDRPLLLLIDDLHRADELTWSFLRSPSCSALQHARVLIVAAYGQDQLAPKLRSEVKGIVHQAIEVPRLSQDHIRIVVRDMLGSARVPEGLTELVFRVSEGNPLFAAETMAALIHRELLQRDDRGRFWVTDPVTLTRTTRDGLAIPDSLSGLMARRLKDLSSRARNTLELAAILGQDVDREMIEELSSRAQLTLEDVRLGLEELVAGQIMLPHPDERYGFAHDSLRELCLSALSPNTQKRLHREAAEWIETHLRESPHANSSTGSLPPVRSDRRPSGSPGNSQLPPPDRNLGDWVYRQRNLELKIAEHWSGAGEPERALPLLERAAQAAESVHAAEQAAMLYRLALRQAELSSDPGVRHQNLLQLQERLADLLARTGRHAEARALYSETLALHDSKDAAAEARLHRKLGSSFWTLHEYDHARASLDIAQCALSRVEITDSSDYRSEWIEIQQGYYWLWHYARDLKAQLPLIENMRSMVLRFGSPRQKSLYHQSVSHYLLAVDRYAFSQEAVEEMRLSVTEVQGMSQELLQHLAAQFNLGFALLWGNTDNIKEATQLLLTCAAHAELNEDITLLSRCLAYLSIGLRRLHDKDSLLRLHPNARAAAERAQLLPYLGLVASSEAWCWWREGNRRNATRWLTQAHSWWKEAGHSLPFRWTASLIELALIHEAGHVEGAADIANQLLAEDQQRLPTPLEEALRNLLQSLLSDPQETATNKLGQVIRIAQDLHWL